MVLACFCFFFFLYSMFPRVLFGCVGPSERWTKERIIGLEMVTDC